VSVLDSLKARLDDELAEDRAFLAKMKPALIKARLRGEAPTNEPPGNGRAAPSGPQPAKGRKRGAGPNPWIVLGAAFVVGVGIAKVVDWRGHAHPRR
jgi:hypothetical protein